MASSSSRPIVKGEDVESEDDEPKRTLPPGITIIDPQGNKSKSAVGHEVKVVTFGEAPETDDDEEEDFGSTISLDSANSLDHELGTEAGLLHLEDMDPEEAAVLGPIIFPQRRSPRLDPVIARKQRDRNKSLRTNISEKFLAPLIHQSGKKFDKLSQNLSNSQMQMQDALFQSRTATGNLLKLQKELENFLEMDYLKELKILPSDECT